MVYAGKIVVSRLSGGAQKASDEPPPPPPPGHPG